MSELHRPYLMAKHFAKHFGVSMELVEGLVQGGQIEGMLTEGKTGARVVLVYRDQVARFENALGRK
jgi:hypothetical protein